MFGKLLKRSLGYTLIFHFMLFIFFMAGFIANSEKYGDDYMAYGLYFNFLFLQFAPITFAIIFCLLYVILRIMNKKKPLT